MCTGLLFLALCLRSCTESQCSSGSLDSWPWNVSASRSSSRKLTRFVPSARPRSSWPLVPAWPCSWQVSGCFWASGTAHIAGSRLEGQSGRGPPEWVMALGPHPASRSQDPWLQRSLPHRQLTGSPVALPRGIQRGASPVSWGAPGVPSPALLGSHKQGLSGLRGWALVGSVNHPHAHAKPEPPASPECRAVLPQQAPYLSEFSCIYTCRAQAFDEGWRASKSHCNGEGRGDSP